MHELKVVSVNKDTICIVATVLSGRLMVGCRLWTPDWIYIGKISEVYHPTLDVCFPSTIVLDTYSFDIEDTSPDFLVLKPDNMLYSF